MTNPIENAVAHSQALYLAGQARPTQDVLNALIDRAEELQAALEDLIRAAEGITPTTAEFMEGRAVIDKDCWDDWDEVVKDARDILNNES